MLFVEKLIEKNIILQNKFSSHNTEDVTKNPLIICSSNNKTGCKVYSRDFLLELQFNPHSLRKPGYLPDIVVKDNSKKVYFSPFYKRNTNKLLSNQKVE